MGHEPIKVTILITGVRCGRLTWRARHHTPALVVAVTDSINEAIVALLEQLPGPIPPLDPPTSLTAEICGIYCDFSIFWGITSVSSLNVLIVVTLFLIEKLRIIFVFMLAFC